MATGQESRVVDPGGVAIGHRAAGAGARLGTWCSAGDVRRSLTALGGRLIGCWTRHEASARALVVLALTQSDLHRAPFMCRSRFAGVRRSGLCRAWLVSHGV